MTGTTTDRRTFLGNGLRSGAAALGVPLAGAAGISPPAGATPVRGRGGAETGPAPRAPVDLTVNGLRGAVGIDPDELGFAWTLDDPTPGARQSAYRLVVTGTPRRGGAGRAVWDSGTVASAQHAYVPYGGPPLAADTGYRVTVATTDAGGRRSPFAPPVSFATGLRPGDWTATWLRPGPPETGPEEYSYLRAVAHPSSSPIVRATAYVAAAHKYQLWVNGTEVDTGPSFSYPEEQYYQASDLTGLLRPGEPNVVGVLHHWYGAGDNRPAAVPGLLAQVSVHHADGRVARFGTDATWRQQAAEWRPAAPRNTECHDFVENIDGRRTPLGWAEPGFDDGAWTPAAVLGPVGTAPFTALVALRTRIVEHPVPATTVRTLPGGAVVADFGTTLAARPTVAFRHGVAGRPVALHVGYTLDPDGHVSTTRATQDTDLSFTYIQRDGAQTFTPYTFLGFRYLEVDAPGEVLAPGQIVARARHTAMPEVQAATLHTSDPTLDAVWALCAHSALYCCHEQFVDTPTRQKTQFVCDATNVSLAAMHAFGERNLSWQGIRDFARSQARFWPQGRVNESYPNSVGANDIPDFTELYPEWVWQYYLSTGDRTSLATWYPVVQRICGYLVGALDPATGLVTDLPGGGSDYANGLVDWPPSMRYGYDMATAARTTINVLAVNALARAGDMAAVLGDPAGAAYDQRRQALTDAVNRQLIRSDGVYIDGLERNGAPSAHASQQANALALAYGVVPAANVAVVGAHVASLGIAMGPDHGLELLRALHAAGLDAELVRTLTDPAGPGWANILAQGGTFCWEDWAPLDVVGDSKSHGWGSSALVAMQEALIGVRTLSPQGPGGGAVLAISAPPTGLALVEGAVPTTAGTVALSWRRSVRSLELTLALPANCRAQLQLPTGDPAGVTESGRPLAAVAGIEVAGRSPGQVLLSVGAGRYRLRSRTA